MLKCPAKHTIPQVPISEYTCPECGSTAESGDFCIDYYDDTMLPLPFDDCELLHNGDVILCSGCGAGFSGKEFAKLYAEKAGMTKCPHCNGTGMVQTGDQGGE